MWIILVLGKGKEPIMFHKNWRGIQLQTYPKPSKPVKHIRYYSWTVQLLQRCWTPSPKSYLIDKKMTSPVLWLASVEGSPFFPPSWALTGHPVPVFSFLLSKHQLYLCSLWVPAAWHSSPEWHSPGYALCHPCVLMDTANLCLLPNFPAVVSSVRLTKGLTAITKLAWIVRGLWKE